MSLIRTIYSKVYPICTVVICTILENGTGPLCVDRPITGLVSFVYLAVALNSDKPKSLIITSCCFIPVP